MAHTWSIQQNNILDWFALKDPIQPHAIFRARAGTGKTTILMEGTKRAPERNILVCAFSKIIQEELDRRIKASISSGGVKAQTLHSVGLGCARRFRENLKIDFSDMRSVSLTEAVCGMQTPDAIKRLVTKLHTKGREIAPHATLVGELTDIAITFECEPDDSWGNSGFDLKYIESCALAAMELASQIKSGDTIDGSDMIFLPVRNKWLIRMHDMVLVDEAQDMTTAQLEIALGVMKVEGRIAVVGDDRQAIFGFRGADSESLDRLKDELNAKELGLTITYRCGHKIVREAQALVPDIEAGPDNPEGIVRCVPMIKLVPEAGPGDFILSRLNAPLVSTAMKLLRAGKRTRIAGRDIGKGLIGLVRKFRPNSVPDFIRKVEAWRNKEELRLRNQADVALTEGRKRTIMAKMEGIIDQADMLISFAEGAKNVNEITDRIELLFADDGLGADGTITCSSVHRAKGLEANRVFILEDTLRDWNQEEKNITYVAITRAKNELVWVSDQYAKDEVEDYYDKAD